MPRGQGCHGIHRQRVSVRKEAKNTVLVIAHRGASGYAPENTLAAFKRALALGATFIETDLQLSRDSHFVAIHDDTVNRTTNGQGKVHDLSLADLRRLDAGSWFGSEFTGERIPTLEEILEFSKKHDVVFYLELKPGGSWGGEHALIGALRTSERLHAPSSSRLTPESWKYSERSNRR